MVIKRKNRFPLSSDFNGQRCNTAQPAKTCSSTADNALTVDSFIISNDAYDFPREYRVPAGRYLSEIMRLEPRIKNGKRIMDICYDLYGNNGVFFQIRESYVEGSDAMRKLHRALIAAGIKPGRSFAEAVGVLEMVAFDYPSKSDFGHIIERTPYFEEAVGSQDSTSEEVDYGV